MDKGKNGDGPTVRVTVRIMVPTMTMDEATALNLWVADLVETLDDATYNMSLDSPRPER